MNNKLKLFEADPNQKSGSITLNLNIKSKPFMEIEGAISAAEAIYMMEYAKSAILEEEDE